ncbi:putative TLC domain-containing protein C17A2.02c [Wickerhamiella sorbophila]|uniref:Putative TLC domain-containing protein C17A2.02c n=1 Tax=Wickerhamiella sorbophila TaxID=45607 RepID=A0A2T0FGJ4_9ASCO|nr:putative TLC domain-containing protein C17A2.02c [Wickerhamiella sorbophila]PRT54069.1 putative TLC domain-containing protein C17A2.02c [Wickerhamiella sorbophila]
MKLSIQEDPLAQWAFELPAGVVKAFNQAGYTELAPHLHEILIFLAVYSGIYTLSSVVTPAVYPAYRKLSKRNQVNFDMHVTSQVQAIVLCAFAWIIFFDPDLTSLTSHTPFSSMAISSAVGYFLWDLYVSIKYVNMFGMPFLAHAAAALFTFFEALRPFLHNYAAPFMLYEMSTPFVNNHWFASHVPGMISPELQKINGLCLLAMFFIFRIVLGSYFGIKLFTEAFTNPPVGVPSWSLYAVLTTYSLLSALNFFWFSKMIRLAAKAMRQSKRKSD